MSAVLSAEVTFTEQIMTAVRRAGWPEPRARSGRDRWCLVRHPLVMPPEQGWKLHVSATVANAATVLDRALPILLREPLAFKVAPTGQRLANLNSGLAGHSQIGKFITVYPRDDDEAVRLAVALDEATRGLEGPAVPSDRPLRVGSRVSYRYGECRQREGYDPLGQTPSFLAGPDGSRIPDRRARFDPPDWAIDPFVAAGVTDPDEPVAHLIGRRYLLCRLVHTAARGVVYEAIDVREARPCVVKQARRGAAVSFDGHGSIDELRNEAAILRRLDGAGGAPQIYDVLDDGETLSLVMEEIVGERLSRVIADWTGRNLPPDPAEAARLGAAFAGQVAALHERGVIHRDLKPGNIILDEAGQPRPIDFGTAHDLAVAARGPHGLGTRGYQSPQQLRREPPTFGDDIYALGAVLYSLSTGAEPGNAPDPADLLARPPDCLNPAVGPALAAVIARCLRTDPTDRYASVAEVGAALRALEGSAATPPPSRGAIPIGRAARVLTAGCLDLVDRLIAALAAHAQPRGGEGGCGWPTDTDALDAPPNPWLYEGDAGVVYALAELAAHRPTALPLLRRGVGGLLAAATTVGEAPAGLYAGLAGIGAALLRAGQALDEPDLVSRAVDLGCAVAATPRINPDLIHGVAGQLRYQLLLFDATGNPAHLATARADGDWLLAAADWRDGAPRWHVPEPWGDYTALGYGHGAAGIADALLDLWEATGEGRYRAVAGAVAGWLAREARPALTDGSGLNWRYHADRDDDGDFAAWCHGAGGIGQFFLHAHAAGLHPRALDLACRAGWTLARGRRTDGPIQCHGLAGHIENLLDLADATGDPAWLAEARSLGELLLGYAVARDGTVVIPGQYATQIKPGLLTGYAGAALALLRLADPAARPILLSRAAFARSPHPALAEGRR